MSANRNGKTEISALWLDAIRHLQWRSWQTAEDKGWHKPRDIEGVVRNASSSERLMLITSEAAEALEEVRAGRYDLWYDGDKPEGVMIELADIIIRVLDMAQQLQNSHDLRMDLAESLEEKMTYNLGREFRHGGKLL